MRTTIVTILNRKGSESTTIGITFNDIPDLIQKIDDATDETGYRKVYVTVDSSDFTIDELNELESKDIFA